MLWRTHTCLDVCRINWVLAEFVRMYHGVSAHEAHRIVDDIVARTVPIIQDFDGALKVLNTALGASEYCLLLLFHRGNNGASFAELDSWIRPKMRANLRRTLGRLDEELAFIHLDGNRYRITRAGERDVEQRRLLEF